MGCKQQCIFGRLIIIIFIVIIIIINIIIITIINCYYYYCQHQHQNHFNDYQHNQLIIIIITIVIFILLLISFYYCSHYHIITATDELTYVQRKLSFISHCEYLLTLSCYCKLCHFLFLGTLD